MSKVKTICIDSSTTNCGIAVFSGNNLLYTQNIAFQGVYSLEKLHKITTTFTELFASVKPKLVIIEETAPVRNSRAVTSLNQVYGAIVATAYLQEICVFSVHNRTAKRLTGVTTKEESIRKATKTYMPAKYLSEHEADAIILFLAYSKMILDKQ